MVQYLMSVWGSEEDLDKPFGGYESEEQMQASFAATGAFNQKLIDQGYFVFANGLDSPKTATVVDGMGDKPVYTDGPYTEAKEFIGGFWVIDVPNLDVALELAAEGSAACLGKVEVRPMHGAE